MNDRDFDDLLDRYFSGEASSQELGVLETALREDAERRLLLAKRSLLDVHLRKAFSGLVPIEAIPVRPAKVASVWMVPPARIAQGAAAAVLCIAIGWLISLALRRPTPSVVDRERLAQTQQPAPKVPEERVEPKVAPEPPRNVVKDSMAGLGGLKDTLVDMRRLGDIHGDRPFGPKKDAVAVAKDPLEKKSSNVDPPESPKQATAPPEPKGLPAIASRDVRGILRAIDAERGTITVRFKADGLDMNRVWPLDDNVTILLGGQPCGLEELRLGMELRVKLTEDRKKAIEVRDGE